MVGVSFARFRIDYAAQVVQCPGEETYELTFYSVARRGWAMLDTE
jgi:hypothetical protein